MYYNPVEVIETNNWKDECIKVQKILGIENPVIMTSKGNLKRFDLFSVFNPESIFSNITPNPTFISCQDAIDFIGTSIYDGVITIGGGSVMDTAKVVMASLGTDKKSLPDLITFTEPYKYKLPSIFIPTTHGTGSEVTMWGTIWNMNNNKKYSLSHPDLYPSVAILDGNLTLTLPLDISITSVMDTLSHSFEAIWNNNTNSTSTDYSIEAITLITKNIEYFKKDPNDLQLRKTLLIAANKAGLSFSNTKTAAAHSISYPLTLYYGIPHGIASSISLVPLLKINRSLIEDSIKKICDKTSLSFEKLIKTIESIPKGVFPFKLNQWGVKKNELEKIASECFNNERMKNNIVKLSFNDVLNILLQIIN